MRTIWPKSSKPAPQSMALDSAPASPPLPTFRRSTAPISCRNMPACPVLKARPARRPGRGRTKVWRRYEADGQMAGDVLSLETDSQAGEPLIEIVMKHGRRVGQKPSLAEIRARAANDLARLPEPL